MSCHHALGLYSVDYSICGMLDPSHVWILVVKSVRTGLRILATLEAKTGMGICQRAGRRWLLRETPLPWHTTIHFRKSPLEPCAQNYYSAPA